MVVCERGFSKTLMEIVWWKTKAKFSVLLQYSYTGIKSLFQRELPHLIHSESRVWHSKHESSCLTLSMRLVNCILDTVWVQTSGTIPVLKSTLHSSMINTSVENNFSSVEISISIQFKFRLPKPKWCLEINNDSTRVYFQ